MLMPWNPMESHSIPRNFNGSGIENLKISGIGMESELKIQNFSITNQKYLNFISNISYIKICRKLRIFETSLGNRLLHFST